MAKKKKPSKPVEPDKQTNLPVKQEEKDQQETYVPENIDVSYPLLSDVCGTPVLKDSLEDVVFNIAHKDLYSMMCAKSDKSFLYEGPPGVGKSFSWKAIRNELIGLNLQVMEMPYDIGRHGTAYINMGAVNLQKYFDIADKYADNGYNCLLLFDEVESIMSTRGNRMSSHKEDDKVLNCLMKNQQRINDSDSSIFLFYATNFPQALDKAAIRSGRIDKIIKFSMPDLDGIIQGYKNKIDSKNKEFSELYGGKKQRVIRVNDYVMLAKQSEGFNYADIDNVIQKALKQRVKDIILAPQDKIVDMGYVDGKQMLYQVDKLQQEKQGTKYRTIGFSD